MKSLSRAHPAVGFIFFVSVIAFGMVLRHPVFPAVSLFASAVSYARLKGARALRLLLGVGLPLLLLSAAVNTLFNTRGTTILAVFPWKACLTLESLVYGLILGVALVSVVLWFACFNETMTSDKLLFVFRRVLPSVSLIVSMTLRFIPRYRRQLSRIADAQSGVGKAPDAGSVFQRASSGVSLFSCLFTWVFENAIDTADSMRARGWGLEGHTRFSRCRMTHAAALKIFFVFAFDALVVFGAVRGATYVSFEPTLSAARVTVFAAAYAALCLLPAAWDITEDIRWNILKSRI